MPSPPRMEKMAPKKKNKAPPPQRRKKGPLYEKKVPPTRGKKGPPIRGKKGFTNRLFSRGTKQAPTIVTPLSAPMNKCELLIHNQNTL